MKRVAIAGSVFVLVASLSSPASAGTCAPVTGPVTLPPVSVCASSLAQAPRNAAKDQTVREEIKQGTECASATSRDCDLPSSCLNSGGFTATWDCAASDSVPCPVGDGFICDGTVTKFSCTCGEAAALTCVGRWVIPIGDGDAGLGPVEVCSTTVELAATAALSNRTVTGQAKSFGDAFCGARPCTTGTCARDKSAEKLEMRMNECVALGPQDCPQGQTKYSCSGRVVSVTCECGG
jgi:hypothetical protein